MITEDYVSFETAKLLKEKGFDEESHKFYRHVFYNNEISFENCKTANENCTLDFGSDIMTNKILDDDFWSGTQEAIIAPTLQMAMKWLREVHNIHIAALCPIVDVDTDAFGVKYNVVISNLANYCIAFETDIEDLEYDSFEEAVEAAIKYCLENLI